MKIYSEKEVRKMVEDMGSFSNGGIDYRINQMTPIELPSDDDIEFRSSYFKFEKYEQIFYNGAKWVIEQIKQQDK